MDIIRPHPKIILLLPPILKDKVERKAMIERRGGINLIELVVREFHPQRLNITLEMLDLAPADNGEDIGGFMPHVRQRDTRDRGAFFLRDLLQRRGHFDHVFRLAHLAAIKLLLIVLRTHKGAAAEGTPGCQRHPLSLAHGDDVAFKVAHGGVPEALVDAELREALLARVLVGLADDPGRGVADAEVEDFTRGDDVVERVHDFGDGSGVVPPVDVEQVDVARLEFLQAGLERDVQAFRVVARVVLLELDRSGRRIGRGELGGEDDLVAVLAGFHPFAEPFLGFLHLVVVGGVDEVAAVVEEVVEDFERGFLVAFAQEFGPRVAKVHGAETEGGYSHACCGSKDSVVAEKALGFWWYWESHCDRCFGMRLRLFKIQLTKCSWKATSFYTSLTGLLAEYLRYLTDLRPGPGDNMLSTQYSIKKQ